MRPLKQDTQRSCESPIPIEGWTGPWAARAAGWQPCPRKGCGTGQALRSLPTQTIPWFYDVQVFDTLTDLDRYAEVWLKFSVKPCGLRRAFVQNSFSKEIHSINMRTEAISIRKLSLWVCAHRQGLWSSPPLWNTSEATAHSVQFSMSGYYWRLKIDAPSNHTTCTRYKSPMQTDRQEATVHSPRDKNMLFSRRSRSQWVSVTTGEALRSTVPHTCRRMVKASGCLHP